MSAVNAAIFDESRRIVLELHALLVQLDPAQLREDFEGVARERLSRLSSRVQKLLQKTATHEGDAQASQLRQRLRALAGAMDELQRRKNWGDELRRLRGRLNSAYASTATWLRAHAVDVPMLRPTNYARSIFHVCTGLTLLYLVLHVMTVRVQIWATIGYNAWVWGIELMRWKRPELVKKMMAPVSGLFHPHEHHSINSASWYGLAMFVLAVFVPTPHACVGLVTLAFADPFAALIGRRWGSIKIHGNRSLQGTSAFVVMGFTVSVALLSLYFPEMSWGLRLTCGIAAGVIGGLTELYSGRLDDNFTIPVAAGFASWAAAVLVAW